MESVKAGAAVDEEGEAINDVEKVLIANGIQLRDGLNTFRDMDTVLSEVAVKYKELGEAGNTVAQGQILTAIAGQRQINIVASLLDGWNDVVKAQETASSSAGIAKSRYEIFLDSVNASMNKFKTSWEAVWQGTVNSGTIKLLYDIGAAIGNILSKTGGLIPTMLTTISLLISIKREQIAKAIGDVAKSFTILKEAIAAGQLKATLANIFTSALSAIPMVIAGVLTLVGVIGSLYTAIKDVYDLNKKADKATEDLAKVSSELEELESKKNRIKSLKEEFDELTKSTDKSAESQKRLNEIQNELKTLLPDLKGKVDELGNYQIDQSSLDSNVAYNKLLQERINLKREESQLSAAKSIKADAKAYEDNLKNINDLNKAIEDSYYWQNKLSETQNYFDVEKALTFILSPEEIESYQSQINEYKDTNLEYLQNTIDSMSILTEEQKSKLKEQLQSFDDFNIALGKYWTDTKKEIEEKPIVPQISYEKLKESADATYDAAQKAVNGVESLLSSLKDGDVLGIDQISSLKDLFPADAINGVNNYTKAISIQNGQIKLNVNGLKELLVAKMESAVASAKEAATTAQAEYAKASAALGATKAIINAKSQEIYIAKALGEAVSAEAYTTLRAAKLKIASEEAVLKAKGIALTQANTDLSIAEALLSQVQSQTYWNNALAESIGDVGSAQNETNKALEAYNDLLDMTIKMLKQRKQDEIDALEEELDNYKKIIDAQKEKLDREKEEADYQKDLADKNKILSDIDNELLQLQFDNSEEAKKRRLELEEERAKAVEDIDETQADRSYDIQKQALDDEYEAYKETLEAKIKDLEEYLDQEGLIRNEAIDLLQARTDEFYQSLIAWNRLYGSGVDADVIDKWAIASNSMDTFAGASTRAAETAAGAFGAVSEVADDVTTKIATLLAKLRDMEKLKQGYSSTLSDYYYQLWQKSLHPDQYHDGGLVGAKSYHNGSYVGTLPKIKETEVFAKLLKGEVVSTESQMKNFINNTLPNLARGISENTNVGNINLSFNIAGSLDRSVLPDIKSMVTDALNNIIKSRGITRNATSFSV